MNPPGFTPSRQRHDAAERKRQRAKSGRSDGAAEPLLWLNTHRIVSTRSHLIASAKITSSIEKGTGDPSLFPPLMEVTTAAFPVDVVVGDPAETNRSRLIVG